jgi:hypothetical protein
MEPEKKPDAREWARQKAEEAKARLDAAAKPPAKRKKKAEEPEVHLPQWPIGARATPNALLRCALFGINSERQFYKRRTLVASLDNYEVRMKGEGFNQTDLDVFDELLQKAMPHPLGKKVEFSAYSILSQQQKDVGNSQYEELKEQIARLAGGLVEIKDKTRGMTFMSTLVAKAYIDDVTDRWVVVFDKDILKLFEGGYTLTGHEQRKALGKSNLAKWLQMFYSTHKTPYSYKVETLRGLCGSSSDDRLSNFRGRLRVALEKLKTVGVITDWNIDKATDLVTVEQPLAPRQALKEAAKARVKHIFRATKIYDKTPKRRGRPPKKDTA